MASQDIFSKTTLATLAGVVASVIIPKLIFEEDTIVEYFPDEDPREVEKDPEKNETIIVEETPEDQTEEEK